MTLFYEAANCQRQPADLKLDAIEPAHLKSQPADAIFGVVREMGEDRGLAARKFLSYRAAGAACSSSRRIAPTTVVNELNLGANRGRVRAYGNGSARANALRTVYGAW